MEKQEIAVIGDSATCTGFRLAGIQRVFRAEASSAEKTLSELLGEESIGIIIASEKIFEKMDFRLKKRIDSTAKPVVITVPDKTGASTEAEGLKALIRRAIGFELL